MTAHITGFDVITPLGLSRDEHWEACLDGKTALASPTLFDSSTYDAPLAGEVFGYQPTDLESRLIPSTDRMTQMSLSCAARAIEDADLDLASPELREVTGVLTAATAGGHAFGQKELQNLSSLGPKHVSGYQSYAWFYAVNSGQISIRHGLRGHSGVVVADGAGAIDAVAASIRRLSRGNDHMVTGAVDSTMCPWGWVAHTSTNEVSAVDDAEAAYLPFDARSSGYVPGEGGAHFVISREDPNGRSHGRVIGYGARLASSDRSNPTALIVAAIKSALEQAQLTPGDVDVVYADASGVSVQDLHESSALANIFGDHSVPVTAPKSGTGRLGCGGSAVDLANALLGFRDQVIPPTPNVELDPRHAINLVTRTQKAMLRTALVLARGRGGFNSAVLITSNPEK
ncbi:beta-ketoacyl synthase N-terminal-like domain-containing protein [Rhodococcus sp. H29-C3]|uniref:beta-ketoacyl synthase N-terminal-like domain-containing protein n=1 Tax=Rhodococcus sp. H29-C3 TaxID=3046307 RepID=UPI0024B884A5|nr:beta-ketoacyl synthase N-terminal-like domain-containing protein [Rhodococcus sp. H29-C3]MDJ0362344.1 beta-ketoacyl synthase N-terminal-like domain-containing protein [Rhodococcus sp. H29-C3]